MKDINLIIDFDSTFISLESMDELALIVLKDSSEKESIASKIKEITNMGMEGVLSFEESLFERMRLLKIQRKHIDILIDRLRENISKSIKNNFEFFKNNAEKIFIISGGFKEWLDPVLQDFKVLENHIFGNRFIFDPAGNVIGYEEDNPLAYSEGKVKVARKLNLNGGVYVIGDGITDFEIKAKGAANIFVAFIENVERERVIERADFVAKNFDEVKQLISKIF